MPGCRTSIFTTSCFWNRAAMSRLRHHSPGPATPYCAAGMPAIVTSSAGMPICIAIGCFADTRAHGSRLTSTHTRTPDGRKAPVFAATAWEFGFAPAHQLTDTPPIENTSTKLNGPAPRLVPSAGPRSGHTRKAKNQAISRGFLAPGPAQRPPARRRRCSSEAVPQLPVKPPTPLAPCGSSSASTMIGIVRNQTRLVPSEPSSGGGDSNRPLVPPAARARRSGDRAQRTRAHVTANSSSHFHATGEPGLNCRGVDRRPPIITRFLSLDGVM